MAVRRLSDAAIGLVIGLFGVAAQAQTTFHQIPYQGRLELDSVAVSGFYDFWFELYPTPSGGDCQVTAPPHADCLWADELVDVAVTGGDFSVLLGSATNPLGDAIWQNAEVYLGIRVAAPGDGYTQLTGRQRILAVPMAAQAATAKNYHVTGTLLVDGAATVQGNLGVGTPAHAARALSVAGADNDGANAALAVHSSGQTLLIDGNEIDALVGELYLQHNSPGAIVMHGDVSITGNLSGRVMGGLTVRCNSASNANESCSGWGSGLCTPAAGTSVCGRLVGCSDGALRQVADGGCYTATWYFNSYCVHFLCVE